MERDRVTWWLKLGDDAIGRESFQVAMRAFEAALAIDPDDRLAQQKLAHVRALQAERHSGAYADQAPGNAADKPLLPAHLKCLYRIETKRNLDSILRRGILSRNLVQRLALQATDISWQTVQGRRSRRSIAGRSVHYYVPLFFCWDTPMNAVVRDAHDDIVIIRIDPLVLLKDGAMVANGNIADSMTPDPWPVLDGLLRIDWEVISQGLKDRSLDFEEWKRRKSAEALVPTVVEPKYFLGLMSPYGQDLVDRASLLAMLS